MKLFFSSTHEEHQLIEELVERLSSDFDIWSYVLLSSNDDIQTTIRKKLLDADVFVLFMPHELHTRGYILNELDLAISSKKIVVPILLHNNTQVPANLDGYQYLDFSEFTPDQMVQVLREVFRAINSKKSDLHNMAKGAVIGAIIGTILLPGPGTLVGEVAIPAGVALSGTIMGGIAGLAGGLANKLFSRGSNKNTESDPVKFVLYNPRQVQYGEKYGFYAYVYTPELEDKVELDVQKFAADLGQGKPKKRTGTKGASLKKGTKITVVPECNGILIEPKSLTKQWDGKWVRFPFDFTVPDDYPYEEIHIRISIQVHGIEVSHIVSSSEITEQATTPFEAIKIDKSPLDIAKERADLIEQISYLYRQIFISYSHNDEVMALKRAAEIEKLLGDKVFIDVKSLRQGEDWEARLAKAIDESDIFHLLWSENSSKSQYCRYEWEYALKSKCPETRCVGVIRPIYWQDPMPKPPAELAHLHFQKVELE